MAMVLTKRALLVYDKSDLSKLATGYLFELCL